MNLKSFIFFLFFILLTSSCGKEELKYTIPIERVYFQLELNGRDKHLDAALNYLTYTAPRNSNEYVGYSGLLVMNTGSYYEDQETWYLMAFDLCCPHEGRKDVRIVPESENFTATCPSCKTVYDLLNGGRVKSGVGTKQLQAYYVVVKDRIQKTYQVYN